DRSGQISFSKRCEKAATSSGAYSADGARGFGTDLSGGPAQLLGPIPHKTQSRTVSPAPKIRSVFAPFIVLRRIVFHSIMPCSALSESHTLFSISILNFGMLPYIIHSICLVPWSHFLHPFHC